MTATKAKRSVFPGWRPVLAIIVIAGGLVIFLRSAGLSQDTFLPIGIGVGLGFLLVFGAFMRARKLYTPLFLALRMIRHGHDDEALLELQAFAQTLTERPGIARWQSLALGPNRLPVKALVAFQLGVVRHRLQTFDAAIADFLDATRMVPAFAEAWYNAAISAAAAGQTTKATDYLHKAHPHATPPLRQRARQAPELESLHNSAEYQLFIQE